MCGIFGLLAVDQPIAEQGIKLALTSMAHRGPDGEGIWLRSGHISPFVALGHRRLAIIDLSNAATQPMVSDDGLACLAFNGEIYNYQELRHELAALGHHFRSESDTEVLLNAYRQWGPNCLSRLNGMFAFAVWNEQEHELFAARDRFGEKPFFYHWDERGGQFAFASEMKAFFASGLVSVCLNDRALLRYIDGGMLDGDQETLYEGINRLLPGRALRVWLHNSRLRMTISPYWRPEQVEPLQVDKKQAAEEFYRLFEDSVRLRLRADVPVGTSLSGGLDSSAVVCMIRRLGAISGQKTFSARMEDEKLDEGKFINIVRNSTGVEGHEVVPTAQELRSLFPKLCWHMEEPFPATSMFAQFLVMRLAQQHQVTVLLDGQGADELLAGYSGYFRLRYGDLARRGQFWSLRREFQSYARLRNGKKPMSAKGILAALLPPSIVMAVQKNPNDRFRRWWNPVWLASGQDHPPGLTPRYPYFGRFQSSLLHDSLHGPLQDLLRYGDRNSMAWSRELRQPFLDHRLAEFVMSLGPDFKIAQGMTKVILRQAMQGLVPDAILNRHDKLGYQAPLGNWLSNNLRGWVEEHLENTVSILDGRLIPNSAGYYRSLHHPLDEWNEGRDVFRLLTIGECIRQMKTFVISSAVSY